MKKLPSNEIWEQSEGVVNWMPESELMYCVNLPHRKDRWSAIQQHFEVLGIKGAVKRFKAIETPGNGAVGCMLSHRAIVEEAKSRGAKRVVIFEDDVRMQSKEALFLQMEALNRLGSFCVAYLGGDFGPPTSLKKVSQDWLIGYGIWNTHAYIINEGFFETFLTQFPRDLMKARSFIEAERSFDRFLAMKVQPEFPVHFPSKLVAMQHPGKSDIFKKNGHFKNLKIRIDFFALKHFPGLRRACVNVLKMLLRK